MAISRLPAVTRPDSAVDELAADLRRALPGEVRHDAYTRHLFSRDASMYSIEPLVVAFPVDARDVATAVAVCAAHNVPILPRGAGTSLAGQTVGRAVILDMSRHMHRIIDVAPEAGTGRGGAG